MIIIGATMGKDIDKNKQKLTDHYNKDNKLLLI